MLGSGGELREKRPRQVAMYMARKFTTASLPDIAAAFGRNGAAVIGAVQDIEAQIRLDGTLAAEIEDLRKRIEDRDSAVGRVRCLSVDERLGRIEVAVRAGLIGTLAFMGFTSVGLAQPVIEKFSKNEQLMAGAVLFVLGVMSLCAWGMAVCAMRFGAGVRK